MTRVVLSACIVLATPSAAFARRGPDATAFAVQADAAHEAGRYADAADLYARAYRAMAPDEKAALGEVIVAAALADLRASYEATSDDALRIDAAELLAQYEHDTQGAVPDAFAEHRAWIESVAEPEAVPEPDEPSDEEPAAYDEEPTPPRVREAPPRERDRDVAGPIAIGLGIAATIGGATMIALGAPLHRQAHRVRDESHRHPDYLALPPAAADAYDRDLDQYVHRMEQRGRALVAVGSVLASVGIGVAIYGAVRIVRPRRGHAGAAARVRPIVGGVAF